VPAEAPVQVHAYETEPCVENLLAIPVAPSSSGRHHARVYSLSRCLAWPRSDRSAGAGSCQILRPWKLLSFTLRCWDSRHGTAAHNWRQIILLIDDVRSHANKSSDMGRTLVQVGLCGVLGHT